MRPCPSTPPSSASCGCCALPGVRAGGRPAVGGARRMRVGASAGWASRRSIDTLGAHIGQTAHCPASCHSAHSPVLSGTKAASADGVPTQAGMHGPQRFLKSLFFSQTTLSPQGHRLPKLLSKPCCPSAHPCACSSSTRTCLSPPGPKVGMGVQKLSRTLEPSLATGRDVGTPREATFASSQWIRCSFTLFLPLGSHSLSRTFLHQCPCVV